MNHRQKVILIGMGLLNLLVIGGLGYVIWRNSQVPTVGLDTTLCTEQTLKAIPSYLSPAIAWEAEQCYLTVTASYDVPAPPESSAQLLWVELDGLAQALRVGCPTPKAVTLTVTAHGTSESRSYIAQCRGEDIKAWIDGTLSPEALAAKTLYRTVKAK